MKRILVLALLLVSITAHAEQMVMLPYEPSVIDGPFGVTWRTMLVAVNKSRDFVEWRCRLPLCNTSLARRASDMFLSEFDGGPAFIYLPDEKTVHLTLRVLAGGVGGNRIMDVPVARAADFTSDELRFDFVPMGGESRQSLRIYDRDGRDNTLVRVQIDGQNGTLVDVIVALRELTREWIDDKPARPAWIEINDLAGLFPQLANTPIASIVVTPLTPDARVWAFVTSTNNETQQFNTFIPQ